MKAKLKSLVIGEFSWKRVLRSTLLIPPLALLGLLLILMIFADRFIFLPQSASYRDTPDIVKVEVTGGERISAKFYESVVAQYTILFSHGNAEDIGTIEQFVLRLRDHGFNVMTYDYRGYGTSNGSPSEVNAYADIEAVYKYLTEQRQISPEKIILHGRSLGGAVAINLAAQKKVGGLILESTFTSAFRVITRYRILPFDRFESLKKIGDVSCPVLVIHGTDDQLIAIHHGEQLLAAANEPKHSMWMERAGHNNVFDTDEKTYLDAVQLFVSRIKGHS